MRKILLFTVVLSLLSVVVYAQDRTISGLVTSSEDGTGIPGVNVTVKGTTTGTVTDTEGRYSISVSGDESTILVFSFIGFKSQEIPIGARAVIDIQMEADVTQLSEVVVTGYTETSQRNLISSIAVVNSDQLQGVPLADLNTIIQGRAPGVLSTSGSGQPGAAIDIRIRGTGSITASSRPLYVIDGVIVQSGDFTQQTQTADALSNINPNDVESINVLKDAAATSLYGSRGANGVVLITTKRGRVGASTITARAQYGVTQKNTGPFEMMSGQQAWEYERRVLELSGLSPAAVDAARPTSMLDNTFDWLDAAFRQGSTSNYEIQAQGGNENTRYFVSAGFYNQDGVLIESAFKRYSVRANVDQSLGDKWDMGVNLNYSYTDQLNAVAGNRFASPLLGSFSTTPLQVPRDENGILYTGLEPTWLGFTGDNFLYSAPRNPVNNYTARTIAKLSLGYSILENLKFTQSVATDLISIKEKRYFDPTTNDGYDPNPASAGQIDMAYNENFTYTTQSKLAGNWSFNNQHTINAIAVMEFQKNQTSNFRASGIGLVNGKLKTLNSTASPNFVSGSDSQFSFFSLLGQVDYGFSDKYFVSVSYRRDGSSRFGKDNRYASFYSVGASWRLIDEDFMSSINVLSNAKIRASYGTAGNAEIGNFESLGLYGFGSAYNGSPGSTPSQIANPDLKWELSKSMNLGLDWGILDGRINGTIDYYQRKSVDLLLNVPISATSGFTSATQNIGSVQNTGIEVTLSTQNTKGVVKWTTDFNISANKNEVLELNNGEPISNGSQRIREGKPIRTWYVEKWAGVNPADGSPLWYTEDGGVTSNYALAGRFEVGNAQPDFIGGLNNTVTYKNFNLSVFFYYSVGNEVYNNSRRFIESDGQRYGWNHWVEAGKDFWEQPGDIATRPKPVSGGNQSSNNRSTRFFEDGSYLRLRNVVLSYNIPTGILSKAGFKNARVYAQGQNLWTLTDYTGFDPEMDETGSEFFRYPVGKSYTFGVELTF